LQIYIILQLLLKLEFENSIEDGINPTADPYDPTTLQIQLDIMLVNNKKRNHVIMVPNPIQGI
jgi:hypothetical protein